MNQNKHFLFFFIFFVIFSFAAFAQPPVASYPFNGNANDVSGNGNNGILGGVSANPVLTSDRFGNPNSAYLFGGFYNKNWIKIPNSASLQFTNKLSISLWFKQCSFGGMDGYGNYTTHGYFILVSKAGDGVAANTGIWSSTYTDVNNILHTSLSNTNGNSGSGGIYNFGADTTMDCFDNCEWVHCVMVVNNTTWQMYINGKLQKQTTIPAAIFTAANTNDMYFGRMWGSGVIWYPFNGVMDDINIYNYALTAADVNSLYGGYIDPLSTNNTIKLDSAKVVNPTCNNPNNGSIVVYPNVNNAPYQFSINGGTFQASNTFSSLSTGNYNIKIKSNCTQKDSMITITKPRITNSIAATICQGQTYFAGGTMQTSSGIYNDTIHSNVSCDTIKITTITVNPKTFSTVTQTICQGKHT